MDRITIGLLLATVGALIPPLMFVYFQYFDRNWLYLLPTLCELMMIPTYQISQEDMKLRRIIKRENINIESYK
jgi:hypothetical protein